jgi:signal recognition particle receptor subunit beta
MSTVNVMAREVSAKVVFYGPGLSGKTTSLKRIYESVKPSLRGELMSLPTEADRTLFFDFLPVRVERVGDYALRLALYTVPGQVFYNATRKLVLQGADGVIFVADSNPAAEDANRESMANLEENLAEQGIRLDGFPLVIQYNKRDLPQAVSLERMRAQVNARAVPDFETCATSGVGVLDAMKEMIRLVIKDLRARKVVPTPRPRTDAPALERAPGLEDQIREHLKAAQQRPTIEAAAAPVPAPLPLPTPPKLGPVAALAPAALLDPARVADACFASGDWDGCLRACQEAVRRGLAFAGEPPMGAQACLLGLDGRDVLDLFRRGSTGDARIDDAAFGLYVVMQTFVRLAAAHLPTETQ